MRIDNFNAVASVYKMNQMKKMNSTAGINAYNKDEVTISQTGKDFQIAKQAVAGASDVREDKVAALKAQIDAGTYNVSAGDFASKLLEKYNATIAF